MEYKYNYHGFADALVGADNGFRLATKTEKVMTALPTEWTRCKEISEIIGVHENSHYLDDYLVPPSLVGRILKDIARRYPDLVECKIVKQEITYPDREWLSTDAKGELAMIDVYDKDGNYVGKMGNPKFDRTTANRGNWVDVTKHAIAEIPYYRRKA